MTEDVNEWVNRIDKCLAVIEEWQAWMNVVHPPEPGSPLFGDDKLYPLHPTSSAASHGIGVAIDHLGLVRQAFSATRALRPFAYYTPLRTALLSASRSVWILSPSSRGERQRRALRMSYEDNRRLKQLVTNTMSGPLAPTDSDAADRTLALCEERTHELGQAGAAVGLTFKQQIFETDIIKDAAKWIDGESDGSGHAIGLQWTIGSGHAHGLSWQILGSVEMRGPAEDGSQEGRVRDTVDRFGSALAASVLTCGTALDLYRKRSTAP